MCREHIWLSIVIPIYNAEDYISNCLDSLLAQDVDKTGYEIICINDGSTDKSLEILRKYQNENSNISVVDKINEGVSKTRNLGLSLAHGDYVWFVDADDWIARNCFSLIKQQIEKNNPSVVQIHYDWIKAEWRIKECATAVLNTDNVTCSVCKHTFLPYDGAWSSIINKKVLERYGHTFYEHLHYGEDILFIRDLFDTMRIEAEEHGQEHIVVHLKNEIVYYYRIHAESAMSTSGTKNREKYMNALIDMALIDRARMLEKNKPSWYIKQYEKLFAQRMYNYMIFWLPGSNINLVKHLECLKNASLYPVPARIRNALFRDCNESNSISEKLKNLYRHLMFSNCILYPIYYFQMQRHLDANVGVEQSKADSGNN